MAIILKVLGFLGGGLLKLLPFLAAFKFGGDRVEKKNMEKSIEANRKSKIHKDKLGTMSPAERKRLRAIKRKERSKL